MVQGFVGESWPLERGAPFVVYEATVNAGLTKLPGNLLQVARILTAPPEDLVYVAFVWWC